MTEEKSMIWKKAAEMSVREAIGVIAGPRGWGDTRESWLASAARKTKSISFRTMRSLWTGEISEENKPDHWAIREIKRQAAIYKAREEAKNVAAQYESIAERLVSTDPDFYSADVAALVHAARILRGLDSA
jgi:hypothetical protein